MKILYHLIAYFIFIAAGAAQAEELTGVQITPGTFIYDSATNTWLSPILVKNIGSTAITGKFRLVRKTLAPEDATFYFPDGYESDGKEYVEIPLPGGWLAPNVSISHSLRVKSSVAVTAATFKAIGLRLQASPTTVQVSAYMASGLDGIVKGEPIGAGYSVLVDGVFRGLTDSVGKLSLPVDPRSSRITVTRAPNLAGSAELPKSTNGQTVAVDVLIDDGAEIYADAKLFVRQVRNEILPSSQSVFTPVFVAGASEIKIRKINSAFIKVNNQTLNVSSAFSVAQGEISGSLSAIRQALGSSVGLVSLEIDAKGVDSSNLRAITKFYIGKMRCEST